MPANWLGSRSNLDLHDAEVEMEDGEGGQSPFIKDATPGSAVSKGQTALTSNTSTGTLDLKMLEKPSSSKKGLSAMRRIYVNTDPRDDPLSSFHPSRRTSKFRSPTLENFKRLSTSKRAESMKSIPGSATTPGAPGTPLPTDKPVLKRQDTITAPVIVSTHASVSGFPSNKVRTSKYTIWTFIPKNLFEQFRSVANFYFTSLVILQIFPPFSQVSILLTAAPIIFIIAVTAVKDGAEDLKRHKSDRSVNKSKTYLLTPPWTNSNFLPHGGSSALSSLGQVPEEHVDPHPPPETAGSSSKKPSSKMSSNFIMDWFWPPPPLTNHPNYIGPESDVVQDASAEGSVERKDSSGSGKGEAASPKSLNLVGGVSPKYPGKKTLWKLSDWEDVKVGDFVFLRDNDPIPADIVILSTSEPDCVAYTETKNLDGETNLKVRRGINDISHIKTPEDCTRLKFSMDSEPPNANLYTYSGVINLKYSDSSPAYRQSFNVRRTSMMSRRLADGPMDTGRDSTMANSNLAERRKSLQLTEAEKRKSFGMHDSETDEEGDQVFRQIPVGPNNILLRGCALRNTGWVIGIAVYTGAESKIMLNSGNTPSKRSRIDRQLNPLVMVNFLLLVGMCLICGLISAVYAGTFIKEKAPFAWSDGDSYSPAYAAFVTFFSCMIIFQAIIPIALYISVDISKTVQSVFISADADMYDEALNKFVQPQAWNLCDDLGQIEYIFSDKTGTLTCNMMEFRRCSINGVLYGKDFVSEASKGAAEREGKKIDQEAVDRAKAETEAEMRKVMGELFDTKYVSDKLTFVDPSLPRHLLENGEQGRRIREFFTLLSVCHTVLVERPKKEEQEKNSDGEVQKDAPNHEVIEYKAQSPDEAALVAAARDVGFTFLKRRDNVVDVNLIGENRSYTILNVLEFNSDRKRMSVVVRRPEGQLVLLVKGADSVIFERLRKSSPVSPQSAPVGDDVNINYPDGADLDVTSKHLEVFANEGLRTLCLAYKVIPESVYEEWNKKYTAAQASIKDREKKVDAVAELLENDLTLMGATAIEDKLQEGVPETIGTLAKAGIKIWVLTGDKMETAINISFSCNLLKRNMILIVIKSTSFSEIYQQLLEALERFWTPDGKILQGKSHALIIDGTSLKYALHKSCRSILLELGCRCNAVVCCRVSPLQKARVVSLVRKGLGAMCLAIGDGANDVSMIQEADVGIGIIGKEGLQAVMASDYAIGQFRFLGKLLLVHGRWGYLRTSELILNYFYKNIVWLFVLFWFQFDCGFSANIITDFTYGMFFNTFFTLFPTMIEGIFDQDVNDRISMQVPQLYQRGIKQQLFTMERFWIYCLDAIYQSLVIYFFAYLASNDGTLDPSGYDHYLDSIGTYIAFAAIITVNLYNGINTSYWPWITFFGIVASLSIWTGYVVSFASSIENPTYGQIQVTLKQPMFYAYFVITVAVALFPRLFVKFVQQYFFPSDIDIISEAQKYMWKEGVVLDADLEEIGQISTIEANSETASAVLSNDSVIESSPVTESLLKRVRSDNAVNVEASKRLSVGSAPKSLRRSNSDGRMSPSESESSPESGRSDSRKDSLDSDVFTRRTVRSEMPITPDGFLPTSPVSERRGHSLDSERQGGNKIKKPRRGTGFGVRPPDLQILKKAGDLLKTPIKLKKTPHSAKSPSSAGSKRTTSMSLVFMGTQEELPNLGFCFSHEGGMADVITPVSRIAIGGDHQDHELLQEDSAQRRKSRSSGSQRISIRESIHEETQDERPRSELNDIIE
ncbi:hypothetical protein HDU97_007695 [Phlyctochytrium planicorne]|nr:hypothetical protein HDU97_007695 [Phlyctochytrium planicorne]